MLAVPFGQLHSQMLAVLRLKLQQLDAGTQFGVTAAKSWFG